METNIFITPELKDKIKHTNQQIIKKHKLFQFMVLPQNSVSFFTQKNKKNHPIYIYDTGFNTTNQLFPVLNHINKTGTNPLRNQITKTEFYDITTIYKISPQHQKIAKIAECFGNRFPPPKTDKGPLFIQTKNLCNHTIAAHYSGFEKVFAFVID